MESTSSNDDPVQEQVDAVIQTFEAFGVPMELSGVTDGFTALRIRLQPKIRVRMSTLKEFADDLCFALAAKRIDITAPMLGTKLIEVAIYKDSPAPFLWNEAMAANALHIATGELVVPVGRNDQNEDLVLDIATLPHLLISGGARSGKTMLLHSIINSLATQISIERLGLVLIDPKRVEFFPYEGLPHLLTPVITNTWVAVRALSGAVSEMKRRFEMLHAKGVRDIRAYHQMMDADKKTGVDDASYAMPYIVVIVDEFSDLMAAPRNNVEAVLVPLLQMGQSVGIHFILATSRPAATTLTHQIKENSPTRIAFRTASSPDSRAILGKAGAEKLSGLGDLLYKASADEQPARYQACYLSETDIEENVKSINDQYHEIFRDRNGRHHDMLLVSAVSEDDEGDELYEQSVAIVLKAGKASTALLQRQLGVGYGRAARILNMLEKRGVIGPADGSNPRKVIVSNTTQSPPSS
jgi:S-DNA-T family DNA segregation ATPase FtsK/SpoIIIE